MSDIVEEKTHAILSPSDAAGWMRCPGKIQLEASFPNESSKYARWGTAAHEIAERCLRNPGKDSRGETEYQNAEEYIGTVLKVEGHDIKVDMEMADCCNAYIAHLVTYIDVELGDTLKIEQQVPLTQITGEEDATGTSDAIGLTRNGKRLVVVDLKAGMEVVYADGNEQMLMYAAGALHKFGRIWDEVEEVECVIVQPRRDHVDAKLYTVAEVREFAVRASLAAARTALPDAERVPGEKQCRWCRAKGICPDLKANALEAVTGMTTAAISDASSFPNLTEPTLPKKLSAVVDNEMLARTADDLAEAYRARAIVKLWLEGVEGEVNRRLMNGDPVPGFKMVAGKKGNRAWADEDSALAELTKSGRLKMAEATVSKIISPTTAEKLLKEREKIWAKIAPLIADQKEGAPTVVPESDPRSPLIFVSDATSFPKLDDVDTTSPPPVAKGRRLSAFD